MPEPREVHQRATTATSVALVVLGLAMIVAALARGGGPLALGLLLGILFVGAGAGRIYVARDRG
jgi:hypothetical protein